MTTVESSSDRNRSSTPLETRPMPRSRSLSNSTPSPTHRSGDNHRNGKSPHRSRKKKQQYSFTQDSPYFTSYVDKEMKHVNVLSETLRDISSKAKTFGKCGLLMSEATRRLSQSCKLQATKGGGSGGNIGTGGGGGSGSGSGGGSGTNNNVEDGFETNVNLPSGVGGGTQNLSEKQRIQITERKKSVGDQMVGVLQVLGDVLDEIADAQLLMVESLEASLSLSLETFIGTELEQAQKLKLEAEEMTESAENAFAKYLHGKNAEKSGIGMGILMDTAEQAQTVASSWNKLSEGVGNQLGRMGISTGGNNNGNKDPHQEQHNNQGSTSSSSPLRRLRKKGGNAGNDKGTGEPVDKAIYAANLKQNLEEIRLSQANAELKRFQLLKHLDALKVSRELD